MGHEPGILQFEDGSGYPRGLRGAKIPLAGRIVAIADAFDALTSRRPYKEPYSVEKAFSTIKDSSGAHFDPDVVDAFLEIRAEVIAISEKYRDEQRGNRAERAYSTQSTVR